MKLKHFLLTALLLFLGVSGVYAGRKYVGFAGSAYNNTQLQNALSEAGEGDTVFVAAGLYVAEAAEFTVKQNVTLIGGYDKGDATAITRRYPGQFVPFDSSIVNQNHFTILDGNAHKTLPAQKHRVITVNAGGVVDGCLIRNGHVRNKNGGGVLLNGGKLYNSIVRGNVAMNHPDSAEALGGGVFIQEHGELINCLVAYNMANDGYGVAAGQGGGKMINNTITANTYSPVFAKISKGAFLMYKGSNTLNNRDQGWAGGEIPKWTQEITLNEFYISRILTTQGQYAVFCAALDVPVNGVSSGQINADVLKTWPDPVEESTVDARYVITGSSNSNGLRNMFALITDENQSGLKYDGGVLHPVVDTGTVEYPMGSTTWFGGLAYCVWLGGGLPTRAQWEFAARREPNGTVNDNLYSGAYGTTSTEDIDTWRILDTIAWVANSRSIDTATGTLGIGGTNRPHEVARKRPNAMGIYDMTGNIAEWNADWYKDRAGALYTTPPYTDPINKTIGTYRVECEGAYDNNIRTSFSLTYYSGNYHHYTYNVGIRPIVIFK